MTIRESSGKFGILRRSRTFACNRSPFRDILIVTELRNRVIESRALDSEVAEGNVSTDFPRSIKNESPLHEMSRTAII